uniref:Uncharacterized protein n=1 Tax=Candidatus Kentrum sp. FW TaxID=2126338 RepID=A0A450U304_9GAMM|nr:MAG: hypothetical protein BECKFW1821C_GA0114237_112711 [Candidatus Kentron sp. FW]
MPRISVAVVDHVMVYWKEEKRVSDGLGQMLDYALEIRQSFLGSDL